jgi:hypothetical protein
MCIKNLENDEKEKILMSIKEKYDLTNKLPENVFVVGAGYNFWLNKDDDIYDELNVIVE